MLALLPEPASAAMATPMPEPAPVLAEPRPEPSPMSAAPPSMPPAPQPAPARSGFGAASLLLAGLVGGAVGGGLAAWLPGLTGPDPALQAVEQRLQRIETAPRPQPTVDPALEQTLRSTAAGLAEIRQATQGLDRRIAEIAARPAPQAGAAPTAPALDELRTEVDRLKGEIAPIRQAAETAQGAATALQPRLAEAERLARAQPQAGGATDAAGRLVLLDRIRALVAQDRPFEAEARALASLGAAGPALDALAAAARTPPPSAARLLAEFRKARPTMTIDTPAANASWTDRLLRLTDGLIRVTPSASGPAPPRPRSPPAWSRRWSAATPPRRRRSSRSCPNPPGGPARAWASSFNRAPAWIRRSARSATMRSAHCPLPGSKEASASCGEF